MIFRCTKSLLDMIRKSDVEVCPAKSCVNESGGLFSWHCNLVKIDNCKAVVFVNDLTRYAVVLYKPKNTDFKHLDELFFEGLRVALIREGFAKEVVESYIEKCGKTKFSNTSDRAAIGHMNSACREVKSFASLLSEDSVIQEKIGLYANYYLASRVDGKSEEDLKLPRTYMGLALCDMLGKSEKDLPTIFGYQLYQVKVQLKLKNHEVWRRILIPSRATFYDLNQAILKSFDWNGTHCHEFSVLEDKDAYDGDQPLPMENRKMVICDGLNPEAESHLDPSKYEVKKDKETVLFEIFENEQQCLYTYDFDDNWQHVVTLEKVIEKDQNGLMRVIEMFGERPPEDVGGEDGYEEYLKIMADANHPKHESMVEWSNANKKHKVPMEEINLKMTLYGWF